MQPKAVPTGQAAGGDSQDRPNIASERTTFSAEHRQEEPPQQRETSQLNKPCPPVEEVVSDQPQQTQPQVQAAQAEPIKKTFRAIITPPVSKLSMQAQEEHLKRQTENNGQTADMFFQIVEKLAGMEKKIENVKLTQTDINPTAIRETVSGDIEKLDREIETLKNDNRQVMDLLVRTQKEQIEKLEAQLLESSQKLTELHEGRGKDQEALLYLDEEKRALEVQLAAERERFDMVLKDREQTRELSDVGSLMQVDVPKDYVVYTGSIEDPQYIEYAKKQFLKIYPKIVSDEEHEDVIYYIPGEFKNPPVLVLNPNVTKNYVRNIKLNLIAADSAATLEVGGRQAEQPTLGVGGVPKGNMRPLSAVEEARLKAGMSIQPKAQAGAEYVKAAAPETPIFDTEVRNSVHSVRFSDINLSELEHDVPHAERQQSENPMEKMVGSIENSVIDSNSITKIPDISQVERQHFESRSKRRAAVVSVLLGLASLATLGLLALAYFDTVSGYQALTALFGLFKKDYVNDFVLIEAMAGSGGLSALVPYIKYLVLAVTLCTLVAGLTMIIGFKKGGNVKAVKFVFLFLSAGLSIFLSVVISTGFSEALTTGYAVWVKLALDVIIFILSCVFMSVRQEKKELDEIKPMTIDTNM